MFYREPNIRGVILVECRCGVCYKYEHSLNSVAMAVCIHVNISQEYKTLC